MSAAVPASPPPLDRVVGGIVEILLGVRAERQPLEEIARPLSAVPSMAGPRATGATTTFLPRGGS